MNGFREPENIMNKSSIFVHTLFYPSNEHRHAAIAGFKSGFQISVVRLPEVDIA
jgi:hypothetical protein